MNEQPRRPLGPQPWPVVRDKLDQSLPFANMRDTPYYRDCIWEQFSAGEYKRRYESLRAKMREQLRKMTDAQRQTASVDIRSQLEKQSLWRNSTTILFFAPLPDEPDIWPLVRYLPLTTMAGVPVTL